MRFLHLATIIVAPLAAHAFVAFTNSNFNGIKAGQPFELTWQGDGTVSDLFHCGFVARIDMIIDSLLSGH